MKLYFRNSRNQERLIAECETIQEINATINQFLEEHNYKSYYTRIWEESENLIIDVGSHSEFFILKGITFKEYVKEKGANE